MLEAARQTYFAELGGQSFLDRGSERGLCVFLTRLVMGVFYEMITALSFHSHSLDLLFREKLSFPLPCLREGVTPGPESYLYI